MTAHDDAAWRQRLTPEQYAVLRQCGTERPGTSPLLREKRAGQFVCAGCGRPLFSSTTKYESGSGWPSFWAPLAEDAVSVRRDVSHGMVREEVLCAGCDGHLGHVFEDGPQPTGQRYCMNGLALAFEPDRD
jgi:peptide-methionine (R)-S-oxide reductase